MGASGRRPRGQAPASPLALLTLGGAGAGVAARALARTGVLAFPAAAAARRERRRDASATRDRNGEAISRPSGSWRTSTRSRSRCRFSCARRESRCSAIAWIAALVARGTATDARARALDWRVARWWRCGESWRRYRSLRRRSARGHRARWTTRRGVATVLAAAEDARGVRRRRMPNERRGARAWPARARGCADAARGGAGGRHQL